MEMGDLAKFQALLTIILHRRRLDPFMRNLVLAMCYYCVYI
jgi:hypothetical protein